MTAAIGRIFDRKYRIVRLIGEGGMGAVYEAEHTVIQRKVAVKVMHAEFSAVTELVERFFREAKASSAIGHPNIIEVFDVGVETDGTVFIVMELLKGESLADKMNREDAFPPENAVAVILQILSALVVAHDKGIVHRDLKPDNIFLSVDARGRAAVKILDFGVAKMQSATDSDASLTQTGIVLGTPHYMSPEQARGRSVDHRIDIWAVGVILYQLLSGKLPFPGEKYTEVLSSIVLDEPIQLESVMANIPSELRAIIQKAMSKHRDDRYPHVSAMIDDLIKVYPAGAGMLTDSAAQALKQSVAPPSPNGFPTSAAKEISSVKTEGYLGPLRRWRGLSFWLLVLSIVVFVIAGLLIFNKRDDRSVLETGKLVMDQAFSFWEQHAETLPGWLHRTAGDDAVLTIAAAPTVDPNVPSKMNTTAPDAGAPSLPVPTVVASKETVVPALHKDVTISIKGLPKGARITANGKKVTSPFQWPYDRDAVLVKMTVPRCQPIVRKIVPNRDQTIRVLPKDISRLSKVTKARSAPTKASVKPAKNK